MNSALYVGTLTHSRMRPTRHSFTYPVYFAAIDVDELPLLDRDCHLFGYNRPRPFSIRDADYAGDSDQPIRARLDAWLAERNLPVPTGPIQLVTNLRTAGYVFNPVSFFYLHEADGSPSHAIADVSNTFGERRLYLLEAQQATPTSSGLRSWERGKELHVSPFFPMDQRYRFELGELGEETTLRVDVFDDEGRVLSAVQRGTRRPFTDAQLIRCGVRLPFMAQRVTTRIHRQALSLWRKGVPVVHKPRFTQDRGSEVTAAETTSHRQEDRRAALRTTPPPPRIPFPTGPIRWLVDWALSRPVGGELRVIRPDLSETRAGNPGDGRAATISIHSKDLYRRLVHRRRLAIGEAFVAEDWDADDLVQALEILMLTSEARRRDRVGRRLTRLLEWRPHRPRRNSAAPARRAIQYHYDIGNDLYALFLDRGMNYSCGVFRGAESLEDAQLVKHRMACDKLQLGPGDHVLEIGCGWGGFAITAAREYGARVTGVTISDEQFAEATRRVAEAGLADRIEIVLQDYRQMTGSFTKIASIEMFEAIGEAEFSTFFATCDRLLADDGLVFLQTIAIPDQRYERYRRAHDWIQEYIFPEALLPSLTAIATATTEASEFIVSDVEDIGPHYARTLRAWRENFEARESDVRALGFDNEFIRTWRFYLASCEAAFATRTLHDYQVLLTRPCNARLAVT